MASEPTTAANQEILRKLQALPSYSPALANLFADLTLEPGDIVTVQSGEESYSLPVFNTDMTWNGKTMTEIHTTGSEKRPAVSATKRNRYASGHRAAQQEQQLILNRADIEKNNTRLLLWASTAEWDALAQQYESTQASALSITSGGISAVAAGSGVVLDQYGRPVLDQDGNPTFDPNNPNNLYSKLNVEKDRITAEVRARENAVTSLQSSLVLKADSATLSTVMDSNGQVTAASIATAINAQGSQAAINADKVILSSSGGSTVTLDQLGLSLSGAILRSDRDIYAGSDAGGWRNLAGNVVVPSGCTLSLNGSTTAGNVSLTASDVAPLKTTAVINATLDTTTNTLTLTKADGTVINFSKAASVTPTLTGAWSGGVYTVTSDPAAAAPLITQLNGYTLGGSAAVSMPSPYSSVVISEVSPTYNGTQVDGHWPGTEYYGNVSVPVSKFSGLLQSKPVTPSWSAQTVSPDSNKLGLSSVTVAAATVTNTVGSLRNLTELASGEWFADLPVTPSLNGTAGSTSTFQIEVTDVYETGRSSVTVGNPTAADIGSTSATIAASTTVTATASNGNSGSATLRLQEDPSNTGHVRVTLGGNTIARIAVSGSGLEPADITLTAGSLTNIQSPSSSEDYWRADLTITKSATDHTSDTDTLTINVNDVFYRGLSTGWDVARGKVYGPYHTDTDNSKFRQEVPGTSYNTIEERDFILSQSGSNAIVTYNGTTVASIAVSKTHTTANSNCISNVTGPFKDDGGNSSVEMFYYYEGTRYSAGRHVWYYRSSEQTPRTMYT